MNLVAAQQVALENDLVAHKKRLKIEKCNARIEFSKPQRKTTYQVTLDALKLSPCYPAFLITAKVPKVYMHQFWNTIKKIKDTDAYQFKLDKKKFRIDTEGMFYQKNVDFVALLWENFMFQADNKEISFARKENMPYPRFTKAIISHFISKDKTISMRNQINLHIVRDDTLLGTLKFVSKTQDYQKYGTLIPEEMINQAIKDSKAYKTYLAYATGATTPKKARKFKKPASPSKKQTLDVISPPGRQIGRGALFWGVTDCGIKSQVIENPEGDSCALQRRVMVLAPGQPIPYGRPYHYHLNGLVHMMTARKRVGPLPTHRLTIRHSFDYSSSNHFSSDDSSSDSSSSSSSETSSDSSANALSNSASSHSSSDHSLPASPSGRRSSHRLCTLVPSVHHSSTISDRPSHDFSSASRSHLLPSPKRIRSPETATDLEECSKDRLEPYVPREVGLGVDFEDESSEPSRSRGANLEMDVDVVRSDGIKIDPKIQAEIEECFAYADALRDRGIDARVVVEAADREESETGTRGPVEVRVERVTHPVMPEDTPEPAQEGAVEVIKGAQREQGHRIVGAETTVTVLTERVAELERDNRRLRGTVSVESQRVDRLQRGMARIQKELRQICRKMPNTRSGVSTTREAVNEQSDRRMAEALRVCDAVGNLRS
ncbi:hypothetical protein Tco_0718667 [Tanacetum coccineum]